MSKPTEKNAIEKIDEIHAEIKDLKQYMLIIDKNIKNLTNKLSKITVASHVASNPATDEKGHHVRLFGKFKKKDQTSPLPGVVVRIKNLSDVLIKERISDEQGYWEARVLSGNQYKIELDPSMINPNFKKIVRVVTVEMGTNDLEVK